MVDVTVRGAGIFGLSVAWSCVRRGARVRVIDPYGVGAGASGGVVGALAPHVPENWNEKKQFQFESLVMAEAYWAEVEAIGGLSSGYARTGRVQPVVASQVDLARARVETAQELWQGRFAWEVVPARGADWEPVSDSGWLIRDTLTARMHPRMAGRALAAAVVARGAEIVTDAPDEGAVVWATGVAGLEELSRADGRVIGAGVKGQGAVLRYDARTLPQIFAGGVHVVPHADGTVAVGSTSERDYADGSSVDEKLEAVIDAARAAVPVLQGAEVIERWAGVRPRARSRAPMLGVHPLHQGAFIANGGFKIGFGMAPKLGEVMADLVLEGVDRVPQGFRPEASYGAR